MRRRACFVNERRMRVGDFGDLLQLRHGGASDSALLPRLRNKLIPASPAAHILPQPAPLKGSLRKAFLVEGGLQVGYWPCHAQGDYLRLAAPSR